MIDDILPRVPIKKNIIYLHIIKQFSRTRNEMLKELRHYNVVSRTH